MEFIEVLTIFTLCFLLRFAFIITNDSDSYVHLWLIKKYKVTGFGKHSLLKSVYQGKFAYPSLPHYIVSLIPPKFQIEAAYLLNILYDCGNIFIFFLISKAIFAKYVVVNMTPYIEPHIMATLLFGTSPILFPYTARLKSFGGRTFGNLAGIIYFASLGACLIFDNYYYLIITVFSGILILLSSQFAMQVMVFFSAILSLIYLSAIPLLALGLVFCVGMITPFLGIKDIIKFKINHYIWYTKNYQRAPSASKRNRLLDMIKYPIYLFSDPKKFYELTFKRLTLVIAGLSLPTLVFLIVFIAKDYYHFINYLDNAVVKYLASISLASLIIFALISFKWLSFLGEAERYFEYSTGAIIILFVLYCSEYGHNNLLVYMVIFHICIIIANLMASLKRLIKNAIKMDGDLNFNELVEFLNAQENGRILSIPTKLSFKLSACSYDHMAFYHHFITEGKIDGFKRQQHDELLYNFIIPDFDYFIKTYNINTFVVEKKALKKSKKRHGIDYSFSNLKLVFNNPEYLVYQS
jgi:hypothetical protein